MHGLKCQSHSQAQADSLASGHLPEVLERVAVRQLLDGQPQLRAKHRLPVLRLVGVSKVGLGTGGEGGGPASDVAIVN